jgi:glycosyltransferase involved in cell wall biosynthesis
MKQLSANDSKINVCLVYASGLSTERGGGVATKILNIVKQTRNKIQYTVLTTVETIDYDAIKEFKSLGVKIIDLSSFGRSFSGTWQLFVSSNIKFDVVHFHELPFAWNSRFSVLACAFLARSNLSSKYIYEHQIATSGNLNRVHIALQDVLFKCWFNRLSQVLVNSKYMLNEAKKIVKNGSSKFSIINLGVDIETIDSLPPINLQKPAVLFFGHLSKIKGIDLLINAFLKVNKTHPQVHLYLIGNGHLMGRCKSVIQKNGLTDRVHVMGAQPQKTLFGFLKGSDIIVLPSRNDAGPLTVLEGMAAGKPIITTSVGFVPEIFVNNRNGLIINSTADQIANAIKYLIDNPDLQVEMGINNLKDIVNYSWSNASQKYVILYKSLIMTK